MRTVTQPQMDGIWSALNAPQTPAIPSKASQYIREAIKIGWLRSHVLEDLIYVSDRRLDNVRYTVDADCLVEALGYRWDDIVFRPSKRSTGALYHKALRLDALASFLLDLEALGFNVDPQPILDHLEPIVRQKSVLTACELSVFWADQARRKTQISIQVEGDGRSFGGLREGRFPNGYRYLIRLQEDGSIWSLTVTGPKHRRRPNPLKTVCRECGHTWYRGDPDSSAGHRPEHKRRMQYLDPQPHEMMLAEMRTSNDPELVTNTSPEWKHAEIYRRALAFKREEGYDFVQWQSSTGDNDPKAHGFLFTDECGVIKGAAAFRWREPGGTEPSFWGLQWVWICPRYRRQGILESRWPILKQRFGAFLVEGPVSEGMQAFLAKHGDTLLMDYPSRRAKTDRTDSAPSLDHSRAS